MRSIGALALILIGSIAVGAQNPALESRVRIGLLDVAASGGGAEFSAQASGLLAELLDEIGFYEVKRQGDIEKSFVSIKKDFPQFCTDPHCVLSVGASAGLDRMMYGSIDKGQKNFGVQLVLCDVPSKQIIQQIAIASEPGTALKDFLRAAVAKLHGQSDESLKIKLHRYYGPEVHNEKQWAVSAGATVAAALVWALSNGSYESIEAADNPDVVLSGIPSRAYHVPMNARPAALAHAYTAASDDAYGVFYNPAGMAWLKGREASLAYRSRWGNSSMMAAFAGKATREIGFGSGFVYNGDSSGLYTEATFISAVGYKFHNFANLLPPLSVGSSVKMFTARYSPDPQDVGEFAQYNMEGSGLGLGLDIGLRMQLNDYICYGVVLKDIPSFTLEKNVVRGKYVEFNPMVLLMGGTFEVGHATMLFAEGQIPVYADQEWKMAGAIEQVFFSILQGRVGARKVIQNNEQVHDWIVTAGLGVDINTKWIFGDKLRLDAAYEYNTIEVFSNVLNFSLCFAF